MGKSQTKRGSKESRGVIYAVTGGRSYIGELFTSIKSLRRHEPDLPITVFSTFEIPERYGIRCVLVDFDDNPHKLKVYSIKRSPYEETLFLDTDTNIRGSLKPLFAELVDRDFCAANAHQADYSIRPPKFISMNMPGNYNTGVLLYRNTESTKAFLSMWERDVTAQDSSTMWAGHFGDQHFFNRLVEAGALQSCGVRWGELENLRWNCRGLAKPKVVELGRWREVVILHQRTKLMKYRKFLYAYSDPRTAKLIVNKIMKHAVKPVLMLPQKAFNKR